MTVCADAASGCALFLDVAHELARTRILPSAGLFVCLIVGCKSAQRAASDSTTAPPGDVTSEDIQRGAPGQPVEEIVAGRVAGVIVTRSPNGGISVRIRGAASGTSEPLYVLDGYAIYPGPDGSLSGVNPHDIESIEVLKDPVDTALYGSRGANGVIIIKTKKGGAKKRKGA